MDDESTCMSEGMTVTFQGGEIERIYILLTRSKFELQMFW